MKPESVAEKLLFSTIRIETESPSHTGVGTGFFFHYTIPGKYIPFIITNRHVVEYCTSCTIYLTRRDNNLPNLEEKIELKLTNMKYWHFHPDPNIDIACLSYGAIKKNLDIDGIEAYYIPIDNEIVPKSDQIKMLDAIEDVTFCGYPRGIWDSAHNLPIFRKGVTATPINIDYENKPAFLVDASVFEGSSGSPVFLYNKGIIPDKMGNSTVGIRIVFLGILSETYYDTEELDVKIKYASLVERQIVKNEIKLNLGLVFKAEAIVYLIKTILIRNGLIDKY